MRSLRVYRNRTDVRRMKAKLPVRQTLLWVGPVFIRIAPRTGRRAS